MNIEKLLSFEPDFDVVGHAAGGEEAIEQALRLNPDVILMDINMDGLDGISATRTITQRLPSAQIIIMSVQSDADYFRRAMLSGARDFLMKPFSAEPRNCWPREVRMWKDTGRFVCTAARKKSMLNTFRIWLSSS